MTEAAMALKARLLALSFKDRLELYWALEESASSPDPYADMTDDEWIEELERRSADVEAGRDVGEDARKVIDELRAEAQGESELE